MKPYYEKDGITLYHGDCLEVMADIDAVDLVVTDPPYNLGLQSFGKATGWGDMMNGAYFYAQLLREFNRLTYLRQGAAWVFNSWRSLPVLYKASFDGQWPICSMLVWDKDWIGPGGHQGLRPSYELIALFVQEHFALENRSLADIWSVPTSSAKPTGHPAEKPVGVMSRILQECQRPSVLDPFVGSGTTLVAAQALGVQAIGVEIEERYCEMAAQRISQGVMQLNDFTAPSGATNGQALTMPIV